MKRTQIFLSEEELAALGRAAEASGRTKSALIREAIDRVYLSVAENAKVLRALRASSGAWRRPEDGKALVERLRSGRLSRLHGGSSR